MKILIIFQHQYHTKIDDQIDKTLASMNQGMINKLMSVLEAVLSKLSRYDEGSLIGSILSFTVSIHMESKIEVSNDFDVLECVWFW